MFYAYAVRFDTTGNLEIFFFWGEVNKAFRVVALKVAGSTTELRGEWLTD